VSRKHKKRQPAPASESAAGSEAQQKEIPFPAGGASGAAAAKAYQTAAAQTGAVSEAARASADESRTAVSEESVPTAVFQEMKDKRDEYLAMAQRAQADLENYRKRMQREMETLKRESLGAFLREFLGAYDDLDRALAEGEKKQEYQVFHDGVRLVRENLWKVMEKAGVKAIPAAGQRFDPAVHEALTSVPSAAHEPNTVLEVFQPGYLLDDFVLRPARVIVSAAPREAQEEE